MDRPSGRSVADRRSAADREVRPTVMLRISVTGSFHRVECPNSRDRPSGLSHDADPCAYRAGTGSMVRLLTMRSIMPYSSACSGSMM